MYVSSPAKKPQCAALLVCGPRSRAPKLGKAMSSKCTSAVAMQPPPSLPLPRQKQRSTGALARRPRGVRLYAGAGALVQQLQHTQCQVGSCSSHELGSQQDVQHWLRSGACLMHAPCQQQTSHHTTPARNHPYMIRMQGNRCSTGAPALAVLCY